MEDGAWREVYQRWWGCEGRFWRSAEGSRARLQIVKNHWSLTSRGVRSGIVDMENMALARHRLQRQASCLFVYSCEQGGNG